MFATSRHRRRAIGESADAGFFGRSMFGPVMMGPWEGAQVVSGRYTIGLTSEGQRAAWLE